MAGEAEKRRGVDQRGDGGHVCPFGLWRPVAADWANRPGRRQNSFPVRRIRAGLWGPLPWLGRTGHFNVGKAEWRGEGGLDCHLPLGAADAFGCAVPSRWRIESGMNRCLLWSTGVNGRSASDVLSYWDQFIGSTIDGSMDWSKRYCICDQLIDWLIECSIDWLIARLIDCLNCWYFFSLLRWCKGIILLKHCVFFFQGMDATNERYIFQLVLDASKSNESQYISCSPKVPSLDFSSHVLRCSVLVKTAKTVFIQPRTNAWHLQVAPPVKV